MSAPVPTTEPTRFAAGDNLLFTRELADYPAGEWGLHYVITNALHAYSINAFAVGTTHSINTHSAVTALWVPGDYQLSGYVVDGAGEQHSVYDGLLTITRDKASTQPIEFRNWAVVALAAIEAAMIVDAGRGGVLEYSINGRSVRASFSEAIKMRDYLKAQVAIDQWGGRQRKILTRFRGARGSYSGPFV